MNKPKKLAYLISHGFAARMVIQTNLLGKIVDSGVNVALIAPDKEDTNLKTYCEQKGIDLYEFKPSSPFWSSQYNDARKYFLEDIKANPALWEKHIYATRYSRSKNPWNHVRPRLLYIAYQLCKRFPGIRDWYKNREQKHLESSTSERLLELIAPDLVISTYPVNFSEAMLLKAAQNRQAKSIIHLLSWDNISCKGHFPQLADEYIAWGPIMKEELKSYYNIPESKIYPCGVPHFDIHIDSRRNAEPEKHLISLGLYPDKPYLFFGMSSPRFAPFEIDIVEHLAKKVKENIFGENMQLIVRPHPQNVQGGMADKSWLPRLQALHEGRVAVDFPNLVKSKMPWSMQEKDMIRLSHLLARCTVSLNSGSTLSIDALMCDRPVILTSFDANQVLNYWKSARRLIDYNHLKKLASLEGISVCKSFEEMEKEISTYINDPKYKLAQRTYTIQQQCHNHSQPATNNIVHTISSIIGTKNNNL